MCARETTRCLEPYILAVLISVYSRLYLFFWCTQFCKEFKLKLQDHSNSIFSAFRSWRIFLLNKKIMRPCKKCNQPPTDASNMMSSWVVLDSRTYNRRVQKPIPIPLSFHSPPWQCVVSVNWLTPHQLIFLRTKSKSVLTGSRLSLLSVMLLGWSIPALRQFWWELPFLRSNICTINTSIRPYRPYGTTKCPSDGTVKGRGY